MAVLVRRDRQHALDATVTVVGASPDADVPVISPHVSRRHALIVRDQRGWLVIDFRSANGVAVNGVPVEVQRLKDGDAIGLSGAAAEQEVRFEFRDEPASPPMPRRRPASPSRADAALRVAALVARAATTAALARMVLDELLAMTGADRAQLMLPGSRSFGRKRTESGPADDAGTRLPGPASRIAAGEDLVFVADCLSDNAALGGAAGQRVAQPILLVRSAVCAGLRLRGTLHGTLQLERGLMSEPFTRAAADLADAVRRPLALALAVLEPRT